MVSIEVIEAEALGDGETDDEGERLGEGETDELTLIDGLKDGDSDSDGD